MAWISIGNDIVLPRFPAIPSLEVTAEATMPQGRQMFKEGFLCIRCRYFSCTQHWPMMLVRFSLVTEIF